MNHDWDIPLVCSVLTGRRLQRTWSKSNVIQTCDGAKAPVFMRFESESARRRHVHCSCSRSDVALVKIFTQETTMVKARIFFLTSRIFQVYDCYFTNVLTQRSCFEALLTADSQCFTRDDARIFVPTIPRRRREFTVSWNTEVFVHCEQWGQFFSPGAPGPSPVSSASQSSPPFPSPSLSTRRNQLSPRSSSSRKHSNVQLVPACVASGNIHNAVSRHLDKNRAKHRRTVFSMNKAQESKQRSTNWRRRHLGNMQQQPRRWPAFDKCVKTKLRLDVYIRPRPPGWLFLRRIYTSRGSGRVKPRSSSSNPLFSLAWSC